MSIVIYLSIVSFIVVKIISSGIKRKRAEAKRLKTENQMQMLNEFMAQQYGGSYVPSFGNSMAKPIKHKNSSIGWICFFVPVAVILYILVFPYI